MSFTDDYWKDLVKTVDSDGDEKISFEEFM